MKILIFICLLLTSPLWAQVDTIAFTNKQGADIIIRTQAKIGTIEDSTGIIRWLNSKQIQELYFTGKTEYLYTTGKIPVTDFPNFGTLNLEKKNIYRYLNKAIILEEKKQEITYSGYSLTFTIITWLMMMLAPSYILRERHSPDQSKAVFSFTIVSFFSTSLGYIIAYLSGLVLGMVDSGTEFIALIFFSFFSGIILTLFSLMIMSYFRNHNSSFSAAKLIFVTYISLVACISGWQIGFFGLGLLSQEAEFIWSLLGISIILSGLALGLRQLFITKDLISSLKRASISNRDELL